MIATVGPPRGCGYIGGGMIPIPQHTHPIIRDLVRAMNARGVSFDALASITGVNERTIAGWRKNHIPRLDNIEAALNGVGLRLAILPLDDDQP
jgi:hypothetical protein